MIGFDRLYTKTARDRGIDVAASLSTATPTTSDTATQVLATFTNDSGRLVVVTALCGEWGPGAGQNVSGRRLTIQPPGGTSLVLKGDTTALAANLFGYLDWQGELIVPPLWSMRAIGDFNAGVAANSSRLFIHGVIIPIGNVIYQTGA